MIGLQLQKYQIPTELHCIIFIEVMTFELLFGGCSNNCTAGDLKVCQLREESWSTWWVLLTLRNILIKNCWEFAVHGENVLLGRSRLREALNFENRKSKSRVYLHAIFQQRKKSYLGFPGGASGKEPACQCRGL